MKFYYLLIPIIMSLSNSFNVLAQTNKDPFPQLSKEVLKTVKQWNRAFDQNDAEEYFTYIHDDLSLFIASSPYRIDGKSDDREEFEWSLNAERTRVSLFQELQPAVTMLTLLLP